MINKFASTCMFACLFLCIFSATAFAQADLEIAKSSLLIKQTLPSSGAKIPVTVVVKNKGTATAGFSLTKIYMSLDPKIGPGDIAVGSLGYAPIKTRKALSKKIVVKIPKITVAKSYYLIACTDTKKKVAEKNERNNCQKIHDADEKITFYPQSSPGAEAVLGAINVTLESLGLTPQSAPQDLAIAACSLMTLEYQTQAAIDLKKYFELTTPAADCVSVYAEIFANTAKYGPIEDNASPLSLKNTYISITGDTAQVKTVISLMRVSTPGDYSTAHQIETTQLKLVDGKWLINSDTDVAYENTGGASN